MFVGTSERRPMARVALLDLKAGPTRSQDSPPVLAAPAGTEMVVVRFLVPLNPDASYGLELQDVDGRMLARLDDLGERDRFGAYSVAISASLLPAPSQYVLLVRERTTAGEERLYTYPFRAVAPH
jgi:hypothetical protein